MKHWMYKDVYTREKELAAVAKKRTERDSDTSCRAAAGILHAASHESEVHSSEECLDRFVTRVRFLGGGR